MVQIVLHNLGQQIYPKTILLADFSQTYLCIYCKPLMKPIKITKDVISKNERKKDFLIDFLFRLL